jgi:hypothetical protein
MAFPTERQSEWDAWVQKRILEKAEAVLVDIEFDRIIAHEFDRIIAHAVLCASTPHSHNKAVEVAPDTATTATDQQYRDLFDMVFYV